MLIRSTDIDAALAARRGEERLRSGAPIDGAYLYRGTWRRYGASARGRPYTRRKADGFQGPKPTEHAAFRDMYWVTESHDVVGLNETPDPDRVATLQRITADGVQADHALAQANEPNQADYDGGHASLNGKPAIHYINSRPSFLTCGIASHWPLLHDGTGCTLAFVFEPNADGGGVQALGMTYGTTVGGPGVLIAQQASSVRVIIRNAAGASIFDATSSAGVLSAGTPVVMVFRFDTSQSTDVDVRVNGTQRLSGNIGSAASSADPEHALHVGARVDGSVPFTGRMALQPAVFDAWLSDADVAEYIEDWAAGEWGVAA